MPQPDAGRLKGTVMRKFRKRASLNGALVLALGLLAACGARKNQGPPAPPPVAVKVTTLTPQTVSLTTDLPGRTVAYKVAEIRPQVSGVIQKRMFVEGSDVKEGQQL